MSETKNLGIIGNIYEEKGGKRKGTLVRFNEERNLYFIKEDSGKQHTVTAYSFKTNWVNTQEQPVVDEQPEEEQKTNTVDVVDSAEVVSEPEKKVAKKAKRKTPKESIKSINSTIGCIELVQDGSSDQTISDVFKYVLELLPDYENVCTMGLLDGAKMFYVLNKSDKKYRVAIILLGSTVNLLVSNQFNDKVDFVQVFGDSKDKGENSTLYCTDLQNFYKNAHYLLDCLNIEYIREMTN